MVKRMHDFADLGSIPSTHTRWLTTTHNSRGSDALSLFGYHIHTHELTHRQIKIKYITFFRKMIFLSSGKQLWGKKGELSQKNQVHGEGNPSGDGSSATRQHKSPNLDRRKAATRSSEEGAFQMTGPTTLKALLWVWQPCGHQSVAKVVRHMMGLSIPLGFRIARHWPLKSLS